MKSNITTSDPTLDAKSYPRNCVLGQGVGGCCAEQSQLVAANSNGRGCVCSVPAYPAAYFNLIKVGSKHCSDKMN